MRSSRIVSLFYRKLKSIQKYKFQAVVWRVSLVKLTEKNFHLVDNSENLRQIQSENVI